MKLEHAAITAQAHLHHQYFLGLQLMVAVEESKETTYEWMFRLFRRQHEEKFLSSFAKLGLDGLPDAVACAKYHVLSNGVGGVAVEYMAESDTRAWVRFRYPRWMYDGPAICGIPVEASRGFLRGWYAQNGVSLNNPRLGFVCVSEDVTGQFGLCGYFQEYDRDLSEDERLVFAPDTPVPEYDPDAQPSPPQAQWDAERLVRANRNYAVEYIRNGIVALVDVLGAQRTLELGQRAARLTGLQQYPALAARVGGVDGGVQDATAFLTNMMAGMGDDCALHETSDALCRLHQSGLRITRDIEDPARAVLLACWIELWRGAIHSHRARINLDCDASDSQLIWTLTPHA